MNSNAQLNSFLKVLEQKQPLYYPSVMKNMEDNPELFTRLGNQMSEWAERFIGDGYGEIMSNSYAFFVSDVNKSQMIYEKEKQYKAKSYDEVYSAVYNNEEHMMQYHWGVYTTTFAWEHHLKIFEFFDNYFLSKLTKSGGHLLDLGSGSGVWSLLATTHLNDWKVSGYDISETTVGIAKKMTSAIGLDSQAQYNVGDALKHSGDQKYDAGISCFVIEHLENPQQLFKNMCDNLVDRGYAFMTAALTAAEVDHIYEIKAESEIIKMAEDAGFRVAAMLSSSPKHHPDQLNFLPRSIALLLQKRKNEIW